ncbi:uncharacterized protein LOC107404927 [Ziziphus jujuba]|uniref:Uncharacterized protein LOC107404927 n=1 Tax=Ziziphus jujuba TaxID=326968 RepID=A0A6P3YYA4_ZIZJJ|nr:uncharacterized protein LOC107404927 [Ziziphus jujuba]
MMNLVSLCLVLTSLFAAGVWSPSPPLSEKKKNQEEVIVKKGHRVVVVEYDDQKQHPNTKISISPDYDGDGISHTYQKFSTETMDALGNAKDKIKEASSSSSLVPNLGRYEDGKSPKELICDAYGKCKHKIATAMEKTKDAVSEKTHEAYDKAKERVSHKAHDVGEAVEEAYDKAKETVSDKAQRIEHRAKESAEKAKETMKAAKDVGKTIANDVVDNVSGQVGEATHNITEHAGAKVRDGAEKIKTKSKKRFYEKPSYGFGNLMSNVFGVMNFVGLAAAFGMSTWVTFISSYVLANALPRHQFGVVQSKIYPVYFKAMAWSIGLALLGHLLSHKGRLFSSKIEMFHTYCLMSSLLMDLANLFYVEPRATKVMFEKMRLEKEEGRGKQELTADPPGGATTEHRPVNGPSPLTTNGKDASAPSASSLPGVDPEVRNRVMKLNNRLKKLNTCSSILNILTLMALSCHLVHLGRRVMLVL